MRIVILGALSAVAIATARHYAADGAALMLAGRREEELMVLATDLKARGALKVETSAIDLAEAEAGAALPAMVEALGGVDIVLLAYGTLTDQPRAETDAAYAAAQLKTNFVSAAGWCLAAAEILQAQGAGTLIVLGSVAGDRGRRSNYVYGAAKAGLGTLVQGIAHRLAGSGAHAVLIKPGFIDTPMTAHLPKGGPLWAKPEAIAAVIAKAAGGKRPIVYAPWFWQGVLLAIRAVPAPVFHKTKL